MYVEMWEWRKLPRMDADAHSSDIENIFPLVQHRLDPSEQGQIRGMLVLSQPLIRQWECT